MSVEDIKLNFNENYRPFWWFRDAWDNFRDRRNKRYDRKSIINNLTEYFPNVEYVNKGKPLREFKVYQDHIPTREEIYSDWLKYLNEPLENYKGKTNTLFNISIKAAYIRMMNEFGYQIYSPTQLTIAFSYMLWRCAEGVRLEVKAINLLKDILKEYNLTAEFGTHEMENEDVDCLVLNKDSEIVFKVSIKCLGALNSYSTYFFTKKHPETDFIIGFKNSYEDKLSYYIPPHKDINIIEEHFSISSIAEEIEDERLKKQQ